jgi:hypothetical protein
MTCWGSVSMLEDVRGPLPSRRSVLGYPWRRPDRRRLACINRAEEIHVKLCQHRTLNLARLAIIREQSVRLTLDVVQLSVDCGTNGPLRPDSFKRPLVACGEVGLFHCAVAPA